MRGVKRTVAKVVTEGARSERVIATVGSEKEQMAEMQEQLKANNHKPNKSVIAAKPRNFLPTRADMAPRLLLKINVHSK